MKRCETCPVRKIPDLGVPYTCRCGRVFQSDAPKPEVVPSVSSLRIRNYPDFVQERVLICACCSQRKQIVCLPIKEKSGKAGIIMHPQGVPNPWTKCPLGRFKIHPQLEKEKDG